MDRRINISPKLLVVIALFLIVAIVTAAWLNAETRSKSNADLVISVNEEVKAEYSMHELMNMDKTTEFADLKSGKGEDASGEFTGVRLDVLLEYAGAENYETIIFTANDGFSSAGDSDETDEILIAYAKDDEMLGDYEKGGTGPLRCVFFKDYYGNRSVMNLSKIECR